MKNIIFASLILAFALYTLGAVLFNWNASYGVYGMLVSMAAEIGYDKLKRRKNSGN